MGFSRQEYWSGLPFPPLGDIPDPGMEPTSLVSPALAGGFFTTSTTREASKSNYTLTTTTTTNSPFQPQSSRFWFLNVEWSPRICTFKISPGLSHISPGLDTTSLLKVSKSPLRCHPGVSGGDRELSNLPSSSVRATGISFLNRISLCGYRQSLNPQFWKPPVLVSIWSKKQTTRMDLNIQVYVPVYLWVYSKYLTFCNSNCYLKGLYKAVAFASDDGVWSPQGRHWEEKRTESDRDQEQFGTHKL